MAIPTFDAGRQAFFDNYRSPTDVRDPSGATLGEFGAVIVQSHPSKFLFDRLREERKMYQSSQPSPPATAGD